MKTAHLFHPNTCCLTDCLVRSCTCGARPVPGPDAPNEAKALEDASELVGAVLESGAAVEWLSPTTDVEDGVLVLHFITRGGDEDDEAQRDGNFEDEEAE